MDGFAAREVQGRLMPASTTNPVFIGCSDSIPTMRMISYISVLAGASTSPHPYKHYLKG